MLKSILAARWYLILGLFTFLLALVLTMPLHFVWRFLAAELSALPVHVQQVSGTLWQGRVQLRILQLQELGLLDTRWQLSPWALLIGRADLDMQIETADIRLHLPLQINLNQQLSISGAEGYLDMRPLRPLLQRQRTDAEGHVELNRLLLEADLSTGVIGQLSGQIRYSGGPVTLLVDNKPVNARLPVLLGQLGREPERAALDLTTEQGEALLRAYLQPDGWAGVELRRRLLDIVGQQWPVQASPDTVIFEASHKVF